MQTLRSLLLPRNDYHLIMINHIVCTLLILMFTLVTFQDTHAQPKSVMDSAAALVLLRVQATQANSNQTIIRMSVGTVVSPEGYVITSTIPFSSRKPTASQPVRTKVSGTFERISEEPWYEMDIISLDSSRGIALLKPQRQNIGLPYLPVKEPNMSGDPVPAFVLSLETDAEGRIVKSFNLPGFFEILPSNRESFALLRLSGIGSPPVLTGSPIIDLTGNLIGIVSDAEPQSDEIRAIPVPSFGGALDLARIGPTDRQISKPTVQLVSVPIMRTLDKHVAGEWIEKFEDVYIAPPGYRILGTTILTASTNGLVGQPFVEILDPQTAVLRYTLKSGSAWDRRRGWFEGQLQVELVSE